MEEQRAIGELRALLRATEQRTENQQQLCCTKRKSAPYDAIIPVTHDPALNNQVETFTARKQQCCFAAVLRRRQRWRVHK